MNRTRTLRPAWRALASLFLMGVSGETVAASAVAKERSEVAIPGSTSGVVKGLAILALLAAGGAGYVCGRARRERTPASESSAAHDAPPFQSPSNRAGDKRQHLSQLFASDVPALLSNGVEVQQLMSAGLETISPTASASEVANLMAQRGVRHVMVTEVYGKVLGVISDRDVLSRPGRTAAALMTAEPVCVSYASPLGEAVDLMLERNISCLPVLRGGFLCGILTTSDVLVGMQCALSVLGQAARELQPDAPGPTDARAHSDSVERRTISAGTRSVF